MTRHTQKHWYSPKIAWNLMDIYTLATPVARAEGLNWYQTAHDYCVKVGTKYGLSTDVVCGVMAALSPGSPWERNLTDTETFCNEWRNGARGKQLPLVGSYGWRNIVKAAKVAAGQSPLDVLSGPKVRAFYQCLTDPSEPLAVCVDRHTKCAALGVKLNDKQSEVRPAEYTRIARHYVRAAGHCHILPHQFQAIIWVAWRATYSDSK